MSFLVSGNADFYPREIRIYGNDFLFFFFYGKYEGLIMVKLFYSQWVDLYLPELVLNRYLPLFSGAKL